jgi:hypothetical protein
MISITHTFKTIPSDHQISATIGTRYVPVSRCPSSCGWVDPPCRAIISGTPEDPWPHASGNQHIEEEENIPDSPSSPRSTSRRRFPVQAITITMRLRRGAERCGELGGELRKVTTPWAPVLSAPLHLAISVGTRRQDPNFLFCSPSSLTN